MIEFYTGMDNQFIVSENKLFRNGEVIAEGTIQIHQLLMHEPAWFIVEIGEENPPQFLKTDRVSAVLPNNEFFNSQRCTRKEFKLSFLAQIQDEWVKSEKMISAVNENHAHQLLKVLYYGTDICSISVTSDFITPTTILV
ncbi:hypothetical protein FAY30_26265 (plasmid) [Bacillus sp. S3]|nr:hypothetical protein FAY30_26265 [Bacillus sp. S3]